MQINSTEGEHGNAGITVALSMLTVLYAGARFLQSFPDKFPMLVIVSLHVLPPALFALVHGAIPYRLRGILTFTFLFLLVGNIFENLSILTGFPFGHYHFTDVMGPQVFHVPILLGLAYVGMGYLSWTLARLILGDIKPKLTGTHLVALPLVASFIMVAWDLSMDPIWSTVVRGWIWHQGGSYFGVPVTNFLGWYLTVFFAYQLFALYLRKCPSYYRPLRPSFWKLPVLFYGISAAGNLLVIPRTGLSVVSDSTGAQWKVNDIIGASTVVSLFTMGAFALLAWVRLTDQITEVRESTDAQKTVEEETCEQRPVRNPTRSLQIELAKKFEQSGRAIK